MSAENKYELDFGTDLDSVIMEASGDTFDFSYLRSMLRKPSEANAIELGLQHELSAEIAALCYMFAQAHMAEKWLGTMQVIFSREKRRHAHLNNFVKQFATSRLNTLLGQRAGPLVETFYDKFWRMPSNPNFISLTLNHD